MSAVETRPPLTTERSGPVAATPGGGLGRRLFPGDRRIWKIAGAALALATVGLLVWLLWPQEVMLGSNSVAPRVDTVLVNPGKRMCVRHVRVPTGTGRVRAVLDPQTNPRPDLRATILPQGGPPSRGLLRGSSRTGKQTVDLPVTPAVAGAGDFVLADVCVQPVQQRVIFWGTTGTSFSEPPVRIGRHKDVPARVSLWFLPAAHETRSILRQVPTMFQRAAIFRPAFIGPWVYWLALFLAFPLLVYAGIRLLANANRPTRRRVPLAVLVGLVCFGHAAIWALATPTFEAPDESEHYAFVQYFAETGKAVDATQGKRGPWSSQEAVTIDATRELSTFEFSNTKPPWLKSYERAWVQRTKNGGRPLPRDNGGGYHPATSTHTPVFYSTLAPAYLATRNHSTMTQLLGMRLTSALYGAVTAALAFLLVLELLPWSRTLAVAAGLLVAFEPMFAFISGAVNNDNGVNMFAALTIYLTVRALRRGLSPALGLGLGASLSIAPLMKGTGYELYPAVAIAMVALLIKHHRRRDLVGLGMFVAVLVGIYFGWDAISQSFHRTVFATPGGGTPGNFGVQHYPRAYLSWLWQVLIPFKLPSMVDFTLVKWPFFNIYIIRGFASFGWYAIDFPKIVYAPIVAAMFTSIGLGVSWLWRHRAAAWARAGEILFLLAVPVITIFAVEAAYYPRAYPVDGTGEQGRYLFPAIIAIAALVIGSLLALGRRRAVNVAVGLVAVLMVFAYACQWLALSTFYL